MSVNPSPIGGFAAQFFDNNGVILSGGKIYTYAAGTTTPQAAYTSATGVTPHANPIILDSAGRVPGGEIWLTDGLVYKFVIETATSILIGTYDNITGVNSNFVNYTVQEEVITATAGQTVFNLSTINYTPGTNSLTVYIDGVNQYVGDSYLETDSDTVTFTAGVHVGAEVKFTTAVQTTTGAVDASIVSYEPPFTNSVATNVENKLAQTVSVKDFGAVGDWNGTQSSPGTGTDDTAAIQAAIDYCISAGAGLFFPPGRYRTTAPLVIDRSFNTEDPINGGMYGISLIGGGAASCQIASDHNGECIKFTGGSGAGWHTYFNVSGIGLLKANYGQNAGSVGLSMNQAAFFSINRFDIYGFEYGIYGIDCLSGSFEDGTIRGNNYGFKFLKGTRSHPNNISFRGVITLNNQIYGGWLVKPSEFNYIGGSIESNGYTGILADPNSWGLYVEQPGTEGSVGINMTGTYIENNNGKADVWILAAGSTGATTSMNTFSGCSFLRFLNTRYVTNNILLDGANPSKVSISGCGFKDYSSYVSDPTRLWVATGDAQVYDGGGNIFSDTTGGFVGMSKSVFAPIAAHHQLPFASLPTPSLFPNGIQYCANGSGSSLPSLAVSDGTKWWQIVLGQFAGNVSSAGVVQALPRGWTCARTGTGVYVVTHNLGLAANSYSVVATPRGTPSTGYCSGWALSGNTFEIYFSNPAGAATDMAFSFNMSII
jgi:hypothetical protein